MVFSYNIVFLMFGRFYNSQNFEIEIRYLVFGVFPKISPKIDFIENLIR